MTDTLAVRTKRSKKTLGIRILINGNSKYQLEYLLLKTRYMAEDFRTSNIKKKEVWYIHKAAF